MFWLDYTLIGIAVFCLLAIAVFVVWIHLATRRLPAPTMTTEPLHYPAALAPDGPQVEAILLSLRRPPERMMVYKHTHAIETADQQRYSYCPELSEAMGRNIFVHDGAGRLAIAVTVGNVQPISRLPHSPIVITPRYEIHSN